MTGRGPKPRKRKRESRLLQPQLHDLTPTRHHLTTQDTHTFLNPSHRYTIHSQHHDNGYLYARPTHHKRCTPYILKAARARIHPTLQPSHQASPTAHRPRNYHPPLRHNYDARKQLPGHTPRILRIRAPRPLQPFPAAQHSSLLDHTYARLYTTSGEAACEKDRSRMLRWQQCELQGQCTGWHCGGGNGGIRSDRQGRDG